MQTQVHINFDYLVEEVFNKCLIEMEEIFLALGERALKEYGLP